MTQATIRNEAHGETKVRITEFSTKKGTPVSVKSERNKDSLTLSGKIGNIEISIKTYPEKAPHPHYIHVDKEPQAQAKLAVGFRSLKHATKALSDYFQLVRKTGTVPHLRSFEERQ